MKIREHRTRGSEIEPWMNKQVRVTRHRMQPAAQHGRLHGSHGRCPYAQQPSGGAHDRRVRLFNFEILFMQPDIGKLFLTQRRERPQSHVQCHERNLRARRPARFEHLRSEVQARRRRSHGSFLRRVYRLITFAIPCVRGAMNVGRQRRLAKPLEQLRDGFGREKPQRSLPIFAAVEHFRAEVFVENDPVARPDALRRFYQRSPHALVLGQRPHQEDFDLCSRRRVPAAVQTRWKHARVVQDQAIARMNVSRKVSELLILKRLLRSRHHQHARSGAIRQRLLRNQLFRQLIIKVRDLQTLILGIESSCDETAAAVIEDGARIRSSVVASQLDVHGKYGGVVPELASREHLRAIVPVVRQALEEAQTDLSMLSAVAVTAGPGLVGSLLVGVTYAKALCFARGIPLIAVNHVEGHIHSVLLDHPHIEFPALALVVSGGHTHLFEVREIGQYRLLGKTRDDAAGEAYDKVAKLLGFGYPGGPIIDKLAAYGNSRAVKFTLAKMKGNALDFSFSGLKTAVLRWTEQHDVSEEIACRRHSKARTLEDWLRLTPQSTLDLLASFQHTVIEELLRRAIASAEQIEADSIIVAGGVACNAGLRRQAERQTGLRFYFPSSALATDNAAMIAAAAFPKFQRREFAGFDLKAQAGLMLA